MKEKEWQQWLDNSRDRLANNLGVMERNDNWFGEKKSTILIENKPWPFVDCKTMTTICSPR